MYTRLHEWFWQPHFARCATQFKKKKKGEICAALCTEEQPLYKHRMEKCRWRIKTYHLACSTSRRTSQSITYSTGHSIKAHYRETLSQFWLAGHRSILFQRMQKLLLFNFTLQTAVPNNDAFAFNHAYLSTLMKHKWVLTFKFERFTNRVRCPQVLTHKSRSSLVNYFSSVQASAHGDTNISTVRHTFVYQCTSS